MVDFLARLWPAVVGALTLLLSAIASIHAVLNKRDVRAATAWAAFIWFVPIFGAVSYVLLGINRIRRRATELRRERLHLRATTEELSIERRSLVDMLPAEGQHLVSLGRLVDRVTRTVLTPGNAVDVLVNGDEAYPAMIEAIDRAQSSVALATYIFDNDVAGRMFADALERATTRGVQVRVLIDSVGARYSWPPIVGTLRRRGIRVARFLHSTWPWKMPYMNLRSHRKILVVDGSTGFTGGMNIRRGHLIESHPRAPVQDIHFRVCGPVVAQMSNAFAEDWAFSTRELLDGDTWFPPLEACGSVMARGIPDGPDEDIDKLPWAIHGALAAAEHSVRIMTPYFLPDQTIITSINVAAMRGVRVEIVLPEKNNLPFVKWATTHMLWQVLSRGCRVVYTPPPFDHSKVMIVDNMWVLIGSANWDARSLRLNFELNLECYDKSLASTLNDLIDRKTANGRQITLREVNSRIWPIRLRDGLVSLATPYL